MPSRDEKIGPYEIAEEIGRGAMGIVYRAHHELTRREVALKVIFENIAATAPGAERFRREVSVSSLVDDDGIVEVYDAGSHGETFYYAMEMLEGAQLDELYGRRPIVELLGYVAQMLETLGACHREGVVHRDLKPENICIVDEEGGARTRLLDFGIASMRQGQRATATGTTLGTPCYMSPEQAMSASRVGPAADIWSVGVILYEMVAGVLPFEEETPMATMLTAVHEPHPPLEPSERCPPELVAIIDRCLSKEPEDRFADALTLRAALCEVLDSYPDSVMSASRLDSIGEAATLPLPDDLGSLDIASSPDTEAGDTGSEPAAAASDGARGGFLATEPRGDGVEGDEDFDAELESPRDRRRVGMALAGVLLAVGASIGIVSMTGGDADRAESTSPDTAADIRAAETRESSAAEAGSESDSSGSGPSADNEALAEVGRRLEVARKTSEVAASAWRAQKRDASGRSSASGDESPPVRAPRRAPARTKEEATSTKGEVTSAQRSDSVARSTDDEREAPSKQEGRSEARTDGVAASQDVSEDGGDASDSSSEETREVSASEGSGEGGSETRSAGDGVSSVGASSEQASPERVEGGEDGRSGDATAGEQQREGRRDESAERGSGSGGDEEVAGESTQGEREGSDGDGEESSDAPFTF